MRIIHELYHIVSPSLHDMPDTNVERRSMDLQVVYYPSLRGRLGTSDLVVATFTMEVADYYFDVG
jgi:hypothetical protein